MCEITNMQNILSTPIEKFRLAEKLPPPAGTMCTPLCDLASSPDYIAVLLRKNFGREMVVS
jgi:hypothetical protein